MENGLDALLDGGRRLLALDPDRFMRVLALVRAYLAAYERLEEPAEIRRARLKRVLGWKADT